MKFRIWDEKYNCWDKSYQQFYPGKEMVKQGKVIQFSTGLKDEKGNDIYEGDILQDMHFPNVFVKVAKKHGAFGANFTGQEYCKKRCICETFHAFYNHAAFFVEKNRVRRFRVVGNIFENLNLFRKKVLTIQKIEV